MKTFNYLFLFGEKYVYENVTVLAQGLYYRDFGQLGHMLCCEFDICWIFNVMTPPQTLSK